MYFLTDIFTTSPLMEIFDSLTDLPRFIQVPLEAALDGFQVLFQSDGKLLKSSLQVCVCLGSGCGDSV